MLRRASSRAHPPGPRLGVALAIPPVASRPQPSAVKTVSKRQASCRPSLPSGATPLSTAPSVRRSTSSSTLNAEIDHSFCRSAIKHFSGGGSLRFTWRWRWLGGPRNPRRLHTTRRTRCRGTARSLEWCLYFVRVIIRCLSV
jgi:hypothetical protein